MIMTHISKALIGISNLDDYKFGKHLNSSQKCNDKDMQLKNHTRALSKFNDIIKKIKVNGKNFESHIIRPDQPLDILNPLDDSIPPLLDVLQYFDKKSILSEEAVAQVECFLSDMHRHTSDSVGKYISVFRCCNDPTCCKRKNILCIHVINQEDGSAHQREAPVAMKKAMRRTMMKTLLLFYPVNRTNKSHLLI